jgi:hypothetical protein
VWRDGRVLGRGASDARQPQVARSQCGLAVPGPGPCGRRTEPRLGRTRASDASAAAPMPATEQPVSDPPSPPPHPWPVVPRADPWSSRTAASANDARSGLGCRPHAWLGTPPRQHALRRGRPERIHAWPPRRRLRDEDPATPIAEWAGRHGARAHRLLPRRVRTRPASARERTPRSTARRVLPSGPTGSRTGPRTVMGQQPPGRASAVVQMGASPRHTGRRHSPRRPARRRHPSVDGSRITRAVPWWRLLGRGRPAPLVDHVRRRPRSHHRRPARASAPGPRWPSRRPRARTDEPVERPSASSCPRRLSAGVRAGPRLGHRHHRIGAGVDGARTVGDTDKGRPAVAHPPHGSHGALRVRQPTVLDGHGERPRAVRRQGARSAEPAIR